MNEVTRPDAAVLTADSPWLRDYRACEGTYEADDEVDQTGYGILTSGDMAMMKHAMGVAAEPVDYSEFYLDE